MRRITTVISGSQIFRPILIGLGVVLTLFGLWELLVQRARFVSSNPPAGAAIASVPSVVTVSFSNKLAAGSRIDVTSTLELLPSGELEYLGGSSVVTKSEIDPGDPAGKTLRAHLRPNLHRGLYWISWSTTAAPWRTGTYGKTAFGVGMEVPDYLMKEMDGKTWERNFDYRDRRAALIGGIVLLALALFLKLRT